MTPAPQKEYIITEEELERACSLMSACGYGVSANYIDAMVKSRPYTSASSDVLEELEKKMKSYFDTGYESEDLTFIEDCFKCIRQQTKEREQG